MQSIRADQDRWEFFPDDDQRWHWRRLGPDGQLMAVSSAGYGKRSACLANARRAGFDASSSQHLLPLPLVHTISRSPAGHRPAGGTPGTG